MKIQSIQQNNSSFGARVYDTAILKDAVDYMSTSHLNPRQKDFRKHLLVLNIVKDAMQNHPSRLDVFTLLERNMGDCGYATGSIKTFAGEMAYRTRASQGIIKPVLGIWRDFLDPVNKDRFNMIMGNRTKKEYNSWWKKYIEPCWEDINKYFGEDC